MSQGSLHISSAWFCFYGQLWEHASFLNLSQPFVKEFFFPASIQYWQRIPSLWWYVTHGNLVFHVPLFDPRPLRSWRMTILFSTCCHFLLQFESMCSWSNCACARDLWAGQHTFYSNATHNDYFERSCQSSCHGSFTDNLQVRRTLLARVLTVKSSYLTQ